MKITVRKEPIKELFFRDLPVAQYFTYTDSSVYFVKLNNNISDNSLCFNDNRVCWFAFESLIKRVEILEMIVKIHE